MPNQGRKFSKIQKILPLRSKIKLLVLQNPGAGMVDVDCMQTRGERRIDIGARAIADHPGSVRFQLILCAHTAIGFRILLLGNFDCLKVLAESGSSQFVRLFSLIPLGHQDQAVPRGKLGQRLGNAGQKLDVLIRDGLREAQDSRVLFGSYRFSRQTLEAHDEGLPETGEPVSIGQGGFTLHLIQFFANLFTRVFVMIQVGDEGCNGALKIDIIFPEGVVGIDEKRLPGRVSLKLSRHRSLSLSKAYPARKVLGISAQGIAFAKVFSMEKHRLFFVFRVYVWVRKQDSYAGLHLNFSVLLSWRVMTRNLQYAALLLILLALTTSLAHAGEAALLLEEPYGNFGAFNPTGHAAIYLSDVCAETPARLRRCGPGEGGVVLSRYHAVGGYDWLAMPLIPYLYAVDEPSQIPDFADAKMVLRLRDHYRREHLMAIIPDDPRQEIPAGDWVQLVGESYDRKIYGYAVATQDSQDEELIAEFNSRRNDSHFNLFFRNCANFAEGVLNFYYPHSIHRSFIADAGLMTPKQVARSLASYSKRHPDVDLHSFIISQVPGSIPRSKHVDGVVESLVKSKKYVVPLALLHPVVTGTLVAAYFSDGRFHPDPNAAVFDPDRQETPVEQDTSSQYPAPGSRPVSLTTFHPTAAE
jgi:hypothetical protein